ncbi:DnaA/Hda family protein [Candidatus Paracaedibacter symbiosus]|uniref:DnaA/Hda family protein n=1 Tax=Candidatus Paracaedibacter symbiosus TaxID=244582 RepID=UPI000509CDC4|nr:DnaA/Hda family protein [Candidatus Paracaedibacter symbiosus]
MTFQQLILPLPLPPKEPMDNFVVGDSNWEAATWIKRWPEWPVKHVTIHGESASGKTHLARWFQAKSNAYFISEADLQQNPDLSIQKGSTFIVDNYDEIRDENWLFHFYNLTKEHEADVLFCGQHSPGQFLFTLPDLRSRMRSILSITIGQPEEVLLKKIFRQRLENLGIFLPDDFEDISHYVLNRIERSYAALDSLILKVNDVLLRQQRTFSLPLVRDVLTQS